MKAHWLAMLFPTLLSGQNLVGTVTAVDTRNALPQVTVLAILQIASHKVPPVMYRAETDSSGNYAITAAPGLYRLCVQGGNAYFDPCQWGGKLLATVPQAGKATFPIQLARGEKFILRVHDSKGFLKQDEKQKLRGDSLSVAVTDAGGTRVLLPILFEDDLIRDYGTVVPANLALNLAVAARGRAILQDKDGHVPEPKGVPFTAVPHGRQDAESCHPVRQAGESGVASSFFKLADSSGAQVSKPGTAIPVSVAAGQKAATITLSVTGGN